MIPQEALTAAVKAMAPVVKELEATLLAQAALEAAAPFLRAQALEDAADEGWAHILDLARRKQMIPGADDFLDWLRARAATERGQG